MKKLMNPKYLFVGAPVFALLFGTDMASASFVSPKSVKMVIVGADVTRVGGGEATLFSGKKEHTFTDSATDFAATKLDDIAVPEGRYAKVRVCYQRIRTVVVDGGNCHGADCPSDGNPHQSTGTDGTLTAGTGGTAVEFSFSSGKPPTEETCAESFFAKPVCVSADSSSCESGDYPVTQPDLYLTLSMAMSISVESGKLNPNSGVYPIPTLGEPGAALLLHHSAGVGLISLLFTADKALQFVSGTSSSIDGYHGGQNFAQTASGDPILVAKYEPAEGRIQYSANKGMSGGVSAGQAGMITITGLDINAPLGSVSITCVPDADAVPPHLGKSYTGGDCSDVSGTSSTWTVQKVVDPGNRVFGTTFCNNTHGPGVCGTTP